MLSLKRLFAFPRASKRIARTGAMIGTLERRLMWTPAWGGGASAYCDDNSPWTLIYDPLDPFHASASGAGRSASAGADLTGGVSAGASAYSSPGTYAHAEVGVVRFEDGPNGYPVAVFSVATGATSQNGGSAQGSANRATRFTSGSVTGQGGGGGSISNMSSDESIGAGASGQTSDFQGDASARILDLDFGIQWRAASSISDGLGTANGTARTGTSEAKASLENRSANGSGDASSSLTLWNGVACYGHAQITTDGDGTGAGTFNVLGHEGSAGAGWGPAHATVTSDVDYVNPGYTIVTTGDSSGTGTTNSFSNLTLNPARKASSSASSNWNGNAGSTVQYDAQGLLASIAASGSGYNSAGTARADLTWDAGQRLRAEAQGIGGTGLSGGTSVVNGLVNGSFGSLDAGTEVNASGVSASSSFSATVATTSSGSILSLGGLSMHITPQGGASATLRLTVAEDTNGDGSGDVTVFTGDATLSYLSYMGGVTLQTGYGPYQNWSAGNWSVNRTTGTATLNTLQFNLNRQNPGAPTIVTLECSANAQSTGFADANIHYQI